MSTLTADTRPPQTSGPTWPKTTANWSTHYSNDVSMFLLPAVIMHLTPCHMELLLTVRKGSKPYSRKIPIYSWIPHHKTSRTLPCLTVCPRSELPKFPGTRATLPRSPRSLFCILTLCSKFTNIFAWSHFRTPSMIRTWIYWEGVTVCFVPESSPAIICW